jgi:hypothetical protein
MTGINIDLDNMHSGVEFGGQMIGPHNLPKDQRGWIAWRIATASATLCRDTDAAVELLLYEAYRIIGEVKSGYQGPTETT